MNDETKVNTQIGDVTSDAAKKVQNLQGRICELECAYGSLVFKKRGDLLDHVFMRNRQMSAILMMTYGDSKDSFDGLASRDQDDVLWMLHQFSLELGQSVRLLEGLE